MQEPHPLLPPFDVGLLWFGLRRFDSLAQAILGLMTAQAGLHVTVTLFQLPEYRDYRCEPPCLALSSYLDGTKD